MRLYRGISVPKTEVDSIISDHQTIGIYDQSNTRWGMKQARPRNTLHLDANNLPKLSDTRENVSITDAVCACGDKEGALFYACKHNRSQNDDTPLLIELDVEINRLAVDGKDFLHTMFQMANPNIARPILEKCFGKRVLDYANLAWDCSDQSNRIALCDMAIFDPAVIKSHHANKCVIQGRYNTLFRSAFTISMPIIPTEIISITRPENQTSLSKPYVRIQDMIEAKH